MKKLLIAARPLSLLALSLLGATALMAQTPRTVWDGVFTAEQAAQGKVLFEAKCAMCHGVDLNGAEMAPALSGAGFISNWSGVSVAELATRIHTSMPANDPGSLTNQQVALAIAYILSFNQFPAGATALPAEDVAQGQINIVAVKPAGK